MKGSTDSTSSTTAITETSRLVRRLLDNIPVSNIYFGIRSFGVCGQGEMFVQVDDRNNCIRLGIDDAVVGPLLNNIEELPFECIKKIMCGPTQILSNQCFIAFSVTNNLSLNSAGVGPNCMLCPTLTSSTIDSGKFILVLLDSKALKDFSKYMYELPHTHRMQDKCVRLQYESTWSQDCVKGFMFSHVHRRQHTFDELRDRAARELGAKEEEARAAKRTRTESSAPSSASPASTAAPQATTATTATSFTPLSPPPLLSSTQEYLVWQAKRDKDIAEIKNTLRDKDLRGFLTQLQLERLANRLTELLLQ